MFSPIGIDIESILKGSIFVWLVASVSWPSCAVADPDYVGSTACVECHEREAKAWKGSHHALAWTWPSEDTIVADFDGTSFSQDWMTVRFSMKDGEYRASVTELDGTTKSYSVHSVVGIEPLQQYLFETEPGRLQSFDVVWDRLEGEWFHLYPDQELLPDDGLHWTGPYKNWNSRCAECHATGYEKNYDPARRSYASSQAEIGVGCEACHGPGSAHLEWAEKLHIGEDYSADLDEFGFTQSFASTEASIQQCGTCHSRRETQARTTPIPGTPFHDSYDLATLRPGLYHADGQILDEVYVYGSFLQSRMYEKGVGCKNCHDPHSSKLIATGNAVCTQCHSPAGNIEFTSLRRDLYDDPSHHFHPQGSAAAQCKSCHMPERVYMGIDWRADHSFRVPRPDLASETGAPDACTSCHEDRDPAWAAAEITSRFPNGRIGTEHYGQTLAKGRRDPETAALDLVGLALDRSRPGIVRATALWLLEDANAPGELEKLSQLVSDPDPIVRAAAARAQKAAPPDVRFRVLSEALEDPVRTVRISAARALLGVPTDDLSSEQRNNFGAAMRDWSNALAGRLDFPETQLQLAGMALTMRAIPQALSAFEEVVRLDPQLSDAWIMIVRIKAATEGRTAALRALDKALEVLPDNSALLAIASDLGRN